VPGWLFGWAAAVVLVVSFVALATLWPAPRLQAPRERRLTALPAWVVKACGALGVGLFGLVVYAGFAGTKEATLNLAPNVIYVHFWVGMVVASVLLGDVFAAFNPWRAVGRASGWVVHRVAGARPLQPRPYPPSWGRWPAALGILAFAWLELVYIHKADPPTLAVLALAYFALQLAAMAIFGVETWSSRGDAFGVYFNLYSRLAPLVRRDGALWRRIPLSGAPPYPVMAGTVALLAVAIGSTTFDGFSNGPVWASINRHLQSFFADLGAGLNGRVELAATVGLLGCVLVVASFYRLGIRGMRTAGEGHAARELADRFVHTLIPIAFAYALAHYFSLVVFQGQAGYLLASDPFGRGWNLFGTAGQQINYRAVSTATIAIVQVCAILTGHVVGVFIAHDRAMADYTRARHRLRAQYPLLVVMVTYTLGGIALLLGA
jgi:hypothetical protein